jgi:hypothetical protein
MKRMQQHTNQDVPSFVLYGEMEPFQSEDVKSAISDRGVFEFFCDYVYVRINRWSVISDRPNDDL